jgi:hypothetical protein
MSEISKIVICLLLVSVLISPVATAMKPAEEYDSSQCELIAKDFQREHNGSLIFMQPLKQNGAWDLGAYNGHFINLYYNYSQKKELWIDYGNDLSFNSSQEAEDFFELIVGKDYVLFDMGKEHPPFPMIWRY